MTPDDTPKSENDPLFEIASDICWSAAVFHAERADYYISEARELAEQAKDLAAIHQQFAMAYLAAGGLGNDPDAYEVLGLPNEDLEEGGAE